MARRWKNLAARRDVELTRFDMVVRLLCLYLKRRKRRMGRGLACMLGVTVAAICCSCGGTVKTTHNVPATRIVVAKDATREELLEKYNAMAKGVKSVNATVELK